MKNRMAESRVKETLQQVGIAGTPQRLEVLQVLQNAGRPLSVNLIRGRLEETMHINKVTVYRIISLFRQKGIIRDVSGAGGAAYLEMATSDHPVHPHFNCKVCGMLNCLAPLTFSQARQLTASRGSYRVDHIEINISGLCDGCLHATKLHNLPQVKGT